MDARISGAWRSGRALLAGLTMAAAALSAPAAADEIGEVSTAFKLLGANHKIVVEAFDDPKVKGVSCFVSRAKTGGGVVTLTRRVSKLGDVPRRVEICSAGAVG